MVSNEEHINGVNDLPKITLYTNHACPYAQRAHITLKELNLPYEEILIDLDKARPEWYRMINPRGLIPTIQYTDENMNGEIITESTIVAQFLAEARSSHILPSTTSSPTAPLLRARIAFFIDTWNSKIHPFMFQILRIDATNERDIKTKELVDTIRKEIEPLLKNADPFLMGSKDLTLAEVHVAPFLIRLFAISRKGEHIPQSFIGSLDELPNFSKWAKAILSKESVREIWDEEIQVPKLEAQILKFKAKERCCPFA